MRVENSLARIAADQSAGARLLSDLYDILNAKREPVTDFECAEVCLRAILAGEISLQDSVRFGNADSEDSGIPMRLLIDPKRVAYYREILAHVVRLNDSHSSVSKRNISQQYVNEACVSSVERINRRTATIPLIRWVGNEFVLSHAIVGADIQAVLDYGFALIVFKFPHLIHQCHLASCGTFWLCRVGDKRRRFCSPRHRIDYGNADAKYRKQAAKFAMKVPEWREIRDIDPKMTAPKWQAILAAASPLTAEHWIAGQKGGADGGEEFMQVACNSSSNKSNDLGS